MSALAIAAIIYGSVIAVLSIAYVIVARRADRRPR